MAQCPQFMAMLIEKSNGFWIPKCLDHVLGASSFHTSWFFQHCRLHAQPGSCSRQLAGFPAAKQRRGTQASRVSGHRFYKATLKVISLGLNAQDVAKG